MRVRRAGLYEERGNIAPLALASMVVLLTVLALCVDQGVAFSLKTRQEASLEAARGACMSGSVALVAKNDEQPGALLAEAACEALRKGGFDGAIDLWFYEVPSEGIAPANRLWVIGLQVAETSPFSLSAGFGLEPMEVGSNVVMVARPYSETRTWRPAQLRNGRYACASGQPAQSVAFVQAVDEAGLPQKMRQVLRAQQSAGTGK